MFLNNGNISMKGMCCKQFLMSKTHPVYVFVFLFQKRKFINTKIDSTR